MVDLFAALHREGDREVGAEAAGCGAPPNSSAFAASAAVTFTTADVTMSDAVAGLTTLTLPDLDLPELGAASGEKNSVPAANSNPNPVSNPSASSSMESLMVDLFVALHKEYDGKPGVE